MMWNHIYTSLLLASITSSLYLVVVLSGSPLLCNISSVSSCSAAFLFYPYNNLQSKQQIATLFGVPDDRAVLVQTSLINGYFIIISCSCSNLSTQKGFAAMTTYVVKKTDTGLRQISDTFFDHLAWTDDQSNTSKISAGQNIQVPLLCGCSIPGWNYMITYAVQSEDTLSQLASFFNSSQDQIQKLSQISNADNILVDQILFIPVYSVPGVPDTLLPSTPQSPAPLLSKPPSGFPTSPPNGKNEHSRGVFIIVGITVALIFLIAALGCTYFLFKNRAGCFKQKQDSFDTTLIHGTQSSQFGKQICGSCLSWGSLKRNASSTNKHVKPNIASRPGEEMNLFEAEKPVVFSVEEIVAATGNFKVANKVGQGAYGSVYFAILRDQEVAIKQMKATKSREFFAELKVLCKVHHTNLVELIGYSTGQDNLFLVYEFAENGALSDRLHDPVRKGYQPLSWTVRAQITLDAARGLEYIHEHTKQHYVHRDVKSSNILLDQHFRAKVADFGLAKLVGHVGDEGATTNVVGTFGYIAPEYVRDGHATSKSDVYAFGVVLMELITGQEAIAKSKTPLVDANGFKRRSLVSVVLSIFDNKEPISNLKELIDPNLGDNYPLDSVFQMVVVARTCVAEDPTLRPDMKSIVFSLSKLVQSSVEWEAAMAGDSQVFSGIVQGR